jgi:hypothetical protein
MSVPRLSEPEFGTLARLLRLLLDAGLLEQLGSLWRLARGAFQARAHEGVYEVLEYEALLELKDTKGERALFHKRQRVRFQQDHIIAFQDQAWGDGEIFAAYRVSPGVAVDRYREGHRHRVLISLRETRQRGDVEEFRIEREIRGGFKRETEHLQTEIDHPTRELRMGVIFPLKRPPGRVTLIEQNLARSTALGPQHLRVLPDGRRQVTWRTTQPRVFETYILRWEW